MKGKVSRAAVMYDLESEALTQKQEVELQTFSGSDENGKDQK